MNALHRAGIDFALTDVRAPVVERARLTGLPAAIGEDRVFHTLEQLGRLRISSEA